MATNPYEVEHNIKRDAERPHRRRPDMSTFTAHLRQVDSTNSSHVGATPVDIAAVFQLVQDQMGTQASDAPSEVNRNFLASLIRELEGDINNPPDRLRGVDQTYLDNLDRVSSKRLHANPDDACPICAEKFTDDPYPLVVELPCHGSHTFDLECVGPWLLSKGTCPMCRFELAKKKVIEIPKDDDEEEEDVDGLYG